MIFLWLLLAYGRNSMADTLHVGVSIPPQRYFVEQIAGDLVEVSVALRKGSDPHTFSPTPAQMNELSVARIFFTADLSSEKQWTKKLTTLFPSLHWVKPFSLELGPQQLDRHFWLSPISVMANVKLMRDVLSAADPANSAVYAANTEQFLSRLVKVHTELQQLFAGVGQQNRFLVLHSAWDVFADEYGLHQIVIEEEGKSVTVRHLAQLLSSATSLGIDTVFADSGHNTKEAAVIASQINAELRVLDPLSGDWLDNLVAAATAIKAGLR